jgi:cobalt-zinc-cadmium efflux system membrane fusion protein
LLAACGGSPSETAAADAPAPVASESPAAEPGVIRIDPDMIQQTGLALVRAEMQTVAESFQVDGRIELNEDATARVGSFVEGVIEECCLQVGEAVKKGQVLAKVHSHEVHDAEAELSRTRIDIETRRSDLEYAQSVHARASRLYELKAGSLADVREAEAQLRRAEAAVEIAQTNREKAENHMRYLGILPHENHASGEKPPAQPGDEARHLIEIRSPMAGIIVERTASPGAVVTPSDHLYVISDLSQVWAIAQVPEERLRAVRRGMPVEISVRAYPGRVFRGRVSVIGDALDSETRTVEVRCDVSNPGRALKTEMYATISMAPEAGAAVATVPAVAVQRADDRTVVFVPAGENSYRAVDVQVGRQTGESVEITNGIEAGQQVVTHGSFLLKSELLKDRMIEEE